MCEVILDKAPRLTSIYLFLNWGDSLFDTGQFSAWFISNSAATFSKGWLLKEFLNESGWFLTLWGLYFKLSFSSKEKKRCSTCYYVFKVPRDCTCLQFITSILISPICIYKINERHTHLYIKTKLDGIIKTMLQFLYLWQAVPDLQIFCIQLVSQIYYTIDSQLLADWCLLIFSAWLLMASLYGIESLPSYLSLQLLVRGF